MFGQFQRNTVCGALVAAAVGIGSGGHAGAQEVTLRMSGTFPSSHSSSVYMETFKSEVARLTKGAVKVDLFADNQLGGAYEQVDQLVTGQVPLGWGGPNFFSKLVPELEAAELPFAANSDAQAACFMDGEMGKFLAERAAAKGLVILGWGVNGLRYMTNSKRPIKTLADMKGLKFRVPASEAWLTTFRALGANPTPLDITEVYQALQQGVVDGQENPPENIIVNNFQEVQKYLTRTGHFFSWVTIFANKKTFDGLKPEYQKAIQTAINTAVAGQRAASTSSNENARQKLIAAGMQYNELSKEAVAEFRNATSSIYDTVRKRTGDKAMDIAKKAIETCSH
jgi:tripartite ATP-independent transporter DctP family solute receptor